MRRILFEIPLHWIGLPDIPVFAYGFMMMVAFMAAIFMALRCAKRDGIPQDSIYDVSLIAIVSGILGSRIWWMFQEVERPLSLSFTEMIAVWNGGLVYYGGLLLAILMCTVYIRRKKLPVAKLADCFAPGLASGIGFGRIGCFLNGCCYGGLCNGAAWYGVQFPEGSPAALHHLGEAGFASPSPAVYPSQLVSSLSGFIIFLIIVAVFRFRKYPGQMVLLFIKLYAISRFMVEFIRDDTALHLSFGPFPGLKSGQIVALITFAVAAAVSVRLAKNHKPKISSGKEQE